MSTQQQAAVDKPKINELNKFNIFTECPGNPGKRSKLVWSIRDGAPRVTVYTNDPNDKVSYGIISAPMNPETFFIFLDSFEKIAKGSETNIKVKIDCFTSKRNPDGTSTNEKILLSELWFGKDEKGIIWISIVAQNRPKIRFDFTVSDWHKFYKPDGGQMSAHEASMLQAIATVNAIRNIYYQLVNDFKQYGNSKGGQSTTNSDSNGATTMNLETDIPF